MSSTNISYAFFIFPTGASYQSNSTILHVTLQTGIHMSLDLWVNNVSSPPPSSSCQGARPHMTMHLTMDIRNKVRSGKTISWTYTGEWRYSSAIPDLGTRWRWVVSLKTRPLHAHGTSPHYIGGWVGRRAGPDVVEIRKILSLPGFEPRWLSP
jgi:hypothetical protein